MAQTATPNTPAPQAPIDNEDDDETPDVRHAPPPGFVPLSSIEALGKSIGEAIGASQRRKQPFGLYDPKSSFHPDKRKTPKLKRRCYQNGYPMNPKTLHDREIELLNQLTHSGRYYDRLVEVRIDDSNADEDVYINYRNRSRDDAFKLKGYFRNLQEMLEGIVKQQKEEDEAEEARQSSKNAKRR